MEERRDNKVEISGVCCADREVRHTVFLFPDVPKDERSHAIGPQKHLSIILKYLDIGPETLKLFILIFRRIPLILFNIFIIGCGET